MATVLLSKATFLETPPAGTVIGTLSVQGGSAGETFAFTLRDSPDERFEIRLDPVTGLSELVVKTAGNALLDSGTDELKEFALSGSATGRADTVATDAGPTGFVLLNAWVAEHAADGTEVGAFSVADPDADESFTSTLPSADDLSSSDRNCGRPAARPHRDAPRPGSRRRARHTCPGPSSGPRPSGLIDLLPAAFRSDGELFRRLVARKSSQVLLSLWPRRLSPGSFSIRPLRSSVPQG